jgi:basic membrane protein A
VQRLLFTLRRLVVLLALPLLCCGQPPAEPPAVQPEAEQPLQVAFLYVGPVGDAGWSWAHDQARQDLERQFPWVRTTFLESVPEGAGAERVLTQLAEKGHRLIFATSFGYMDPVITVAARYPDVTFMHCSGYKRAPNVGTYFGRMYQAKYLAGYIAGKVSKAGVVGYIAPHPIPEVIRHLDAFALGVRAANPTATVRVVWTNSWFDPGKEKEAATSLLDAGADVVATGADSAAPMQAAQEKGALAIGYDSDGRQFAPDAFLTAPIWDWSVVYRDVAQKVHDGTWTSGDFWGGMDTGVVKLAPMSDKVPPEVQAEVQVLQERIIAGDLVVFRGPWNWQDGSLAYAEGQVPTDEDLLSLTRFVEGVEGTIPE